MSGKPAFEMPLSYVSKCDATKSEAVLEFQINEDCPVQLMEMRFFMPNDPEKGDDVDVVEVHLGWQAFVTSRSRNSGRR